MHLQRLPQVRLRYAARRRKPMEGGNTKLKGLVGGTNMNLKNIDQPKSAALVSVNKKICKDFQACLKNRLRESPKHHLGEDDP